MPQADDETLAHEDDHPAVKQAIERVQRCEDRVTDLLERVAKITKLFGQAEGNAAKARPDALPVLNIADWVREAREDALERTAATA